MMTLYFQGEAGVEARVWQAGDGLPPATVWIDMENGTPDEEEFVRSVSGVAMPTREEAQKNEALSRMYRADGVSYMVAQVITKANGPYPETASIVFMVTETCLMTVRSIAPTSFAKFAQRLMTESRDLSSGPELMEGLLEEMILRASYNSDLVVTELDELSHNIFDPYGLAEETDKNTSDQMRDALRKLGSLADLNGKINETLHSFARLISFFRESQGDNLYLCRKLDVLAVDVKELVKQTSFLSDKLTFQLDATLGMINVEQNVIMKILSVFTVVIMPPTLIGSIYGMNFAHMPELNQTWGYPAALVLMVVCAVGPFMYFRARRWL
ncbi:MAG: CorA family divalent cation transporter [Alphaproteobacteria bacterium]